MIGTLKIHLKNFETMDGGRGLKYRYDAIRG
jgi:hypothetical protein